MKLGRSIAAHSILALGGLVLAYLVWTGEGGVERGEDEVTLVACDPDDLVRVELRSEEKDVTLERQEDEGGSLSWLTVTRRPERGEPTTERFVGSEAVGEWVAEVAPLRARRSLGDLSAEQLAEVGLDSPEGRLSLRCGSTSTTWQLGGRAYGTGDRYVRAQSGGPVYLVGSDRLAPLESAEFRLMQRELHTFEWRDVVSLSLRAFDQQKNLLQRNRLDEQRAEWVDAASPDRRDETYGNWLSRFPRLRVQKYLDPDGQPGSDLDGISAPFERVLRTDITGEDGVLGFLELARVDGAERAYYARTETTRSWVRVPTSVAQQIEDDLRSMLGVAPLERLAAPPPSSPAGPGDAGAGPDAGAAPGAGAAPAQTPAPADPAPASAREAEASEGEAAPLPARPAPSRPGPAPRTRREPAPAEPAPAEPEPAAPEPTQP